MSPLIAEGLRPNHQLKWSLVRTEPGCVVLLLSSLFTVFRGIKYTEIHLKVKFEISLKELKEKGNCSQPVSSNRRHSVICGVSRSEDQRGLDIEYGLRISDI